MFHLGEFRNLTLRALQFAVAVHLSHFGESPLIRHLRGDRILGGSRATRKLGYYPILFLEAWS